MKKYSKYFEKAPKGNLYITEMRRCVAFHLLEKGVEKVDIGTILYGYELRWNVKYILKLPPENQEVIECWKKWIDKGVYPVPIKAQVKADPMTKAQRQKANSMGNIFVTKRKIKLVRLG